MNPLGMTQNLLRLLHWEISQDFDLMATLRYLHFTQMSIDAIEWESIATKQILDCRLST